MSLENTQPPTLVEYLVVERPFTGSALRVPTQVELENDDQAIGYAAAIMRHRLLLLQDEAAQPVVEVWRLTTHGTAANDTQPVRAVWVADWEGHPVEDDIVPFLKKSKSTSTNMD